jgi:hypothetical protein
MTLAALGALAGVPAGVVAWLELRYARGKRRAEQAFRDERVTKLGALGSTRTLAVLPLVDWFPGQPGLRGEAGVSYLIKTDDSTPPAVAMWSVTSRSSRATHRAGCP